MTGQEIGIVAIGIIAEVLFILIVGYAVLFSLIANYNWKANKNQKYIDDYEQNNRY